MMTIRKYPRTLQEAFGPYAHGSQLYTEYDPMPTSDKIVVVACAIGGLAFMAMILMGWVK